jgi:hypothetical protein
MAYTAEISRANPTCFLFLVDQSGSMAERFGGDAGKTKAQGVADAINRLLQTLVFRCAKGEYVLDRYYIGAIGYGGEIGMGLPVPALSGSVLHPVSAIAANPLRVENRVKRVEDGAGGLVEQRVRFPIWFEPKAKGKTLMCTALQSAYDVLCDFVSQHPGCYPPIIINVTDGLATDGDPEPIAKSIRNVLSYDGGTLLFNLHLSVLGERPILFPSDDSRLPDGYARLLFRMSSPLPAPMLRQAQAMEKSVGAGAVGFAFNADLASIIMFLDIGTRVDNSAWQ